MKSKNKIVVVIFLLIVANLNGQSDAFNNAFFNLEQSLEGARTMKFSDAVFEVENAFSDNLLRREHFNFQIQSLTEFTRITKINTKIKYEGKDKDKVLTYAALFSVFTDTIGILIGKDTVFWKGFRYDFDDIFGRHHWEKMFVTKLLETNRGNCHSMPYLYKIVCDELAVSCHLALAPNHIYIKQRAEKGGWYNIELTSATFPIDAWLMASGYISLEAVQKGIFLDTLSEKESIALCVLDLAQGYNHKYPDNDGKFVIECCDLALKHFPDYVNAILLKAETRLKQLQIMQKEMKYSYLKDVTAMPEGKAKWDEMNSLYMQLYKLGYRQMPEQMYVEWLTSLKTEKEKYSNKNAPGATKD